MNDHGGPWVQMAAFCEKVLIERDGVPSVIRVIDQITHTIAGPEAPDALPPFNVQLQVIVMLKAGRARGRSEFTLVVERPDGIRREAGTGSVHFEGGPNSGANIPISLVVTFEMEGLYWFDLLVDGRLMTRMPLMVRYNRVIGAVIGAP
jgi:hypothetical protein